MGLLRAAIYCRCSTEEESQVDALKKQVKESEDCIRAQGWCLTERYVESKSGTTTKGRDEYNRLFDDMLEDKFDVIVIKSQDRLMRNVKDWYLFLDRLVGQKKRLFMYIEQKFYTTDQALITGIKAILAEEYSRELSKKINNAHRHRQLNGGRAMLTSKVFGFKKKQDGSVEVVEEEAEIIRKIYEYCAAGYGSRTIANIFLNQEYKKRTGNVLTAASVGKIIRNPLYKGTMVMNRLHYDFETKRTLKVPEEQWIYAEGIVPGIVDRRLWEQANRKMSERAKVFHRDRIYKKGSNPGAYDLSGKLVCGQCGKPYYRTWRHGYADKEKVIIEWKCSNYLEKGRTEENSKGKNRKVKKEFGGGCDNAHLDEAVVYALLEQISSQYYDLHRQDKDNIINHVIRILRQVLEKAPGKKEWTRMEEEEKNLRRQKDTLMNKLLEQVISDQDYQRKNEELEKRIGEIQQQKDAARQKEQEIQNMEKRIEIIRARMERGGIEKATVVGMLRDIQEIRVQGWRLEVYFDPLRIAGLGERGTGEGDLVKEMLSEDFAIKVDYPFAPETERGRYLDRRQIMDLLKDNPKETAKSLAAGMGRSACMVRNRMEELTRGGYIRFHGRGGRGEWEILKELPDKEVSIREGGL